jgi:hypothetical protein
MFNHLLSVRLTALTISVLACTPLSAATIFALTSSNTIVAFDSATPGTSAAATIPASGIPITGLLPAETLLTIDFRPSTGELYGIGSTMRLYKLNVQLNVLTPPATAVATTVSAAPFTTPAAGVKYGMDFNAVPDRIRLVNVTQDNLRVNPNNGSLSGTDTDLNPAGTVVDIAYDQSFPGSTTTTVYAIDSGSNLLKRLGGVNGSVSPNTGILTDIGPLGVDFTTFSSIDFGAGSQLYALLRVASVTGLYTINKSTGAATLVGNVAGNPLILGMAIAPQYATAKKKSIKLNFAKDDSDSISFSGALDVPSSYIAMAPVQPTAEVWVGGIKRTFLLDEKGRGVSGTDKITLSIGIKKGLLGGTYKLSLKKGNFADLLADEGLVDADLTAQPVRVPVSIYVNQTQFITSPDIFLSYSARAGKSGKAK